VVVSAEKDSVGQIGAAGVTDRPLIVMGHSTGGLTLSLWAARHAGIANAIVLNSPWPEFQGRELGRAALTPVVEL
jgi:alpha-beta hydrolase superfamily lysophospholipase